MFSASLFGPLLPAVFLFLLLISLSYSCVLCISFWALTSCDVSFLIADFLVLQLCSLHLHLRPWLPAVFLFLLLISLSYSCVFCAFTWGPDFMLQCSFSYCFFPYLTAVFPAPSPGALSSCSNSFLIADFPVLQLCSLHPNLGPGYLLCSFSYFLFPCLTAVFPASPSGVLTSCNVPFLIADFSVLQLCSLHPHLRPRLLFLADFSVLQLCSLHLHLGP